MRFKQIWDYLPLPAKLRLFWQRVTSSRVTSIYFIFSALHCVVQVIIQIQAFSINAQAADFLYRLIDQGDAFDPGFAVMSRDDLRFCESVPVSLSVASCQVIWRDKNQTAISQADLENAENLAGSSSVPLADPAPASFESVSNAELSTVPSTLATTPASTNPNPISSVVLPVGSSSAAASLRPPLPSLSPAVSRPIPAASGLPVAIADDDVFEDAISELFGIESDDEDEAESDVEDLFESDSESESDDDEDFDKRAFMVTAVNVDGSLDVTINGPGFNNRNVELSRLCLYTLNWPLEKLEFTKREDLTFIAFQFWVLGMSVVALLNESMPHIIASLLTHVLATGWAVFQITHTASFHSDFTRLTTNGECGLNLLPEYWKARAAAEIPSLTLNVVALLLSAFLSWRLIKLFGWQTFKRVGASRTINRIYMMVLSLSIAIQLSLFFIVVSIALWIDQLYNGKVAVMAGGAKAYKGVLITTLLLLCPWLYIGWIAVRRELKLLMAVFLVMAMLYLVGWGAMFMSETFRWTFVLWRFFSIVASSSVLLTSVTFLLGVFCRINFGNGLPRYLSSQEPLPGDDFQPATTGQKGDLEAEKVAFPDFGPVPTYSATFGRGDGAFPPSQLRYGQPRLGPRFANTSLPPFEPQPTHHSGAGANHVRSTTRSTTSGWDAATVISTTQLSRQLSVDSRGSFDDLKAGDYSNRHVDHMRWIIE